MVTRAFTKRGGWGQHSPATYRSGLEEKVAEQIESAGLPVAFEQFVVPYLIPESAHSYHPDFVLPNGIIIETKGIFDSDDRRKHSLIREQHPELDIRFVFSSSRSKLYKGSPTSYAEWCNKNGFKYSDKTIPQAWLSEKGSGLPPEQSLRPKKTKKKE